MISICYISIGSINYLSIMKLIRFPLMLERSQLDHKDYQEEGVSCAVINARFIKPLDQDLLLTWARGTRGVVTFEEGCDPGGFSSAVLEALADQGCPTPLLRCAVPDRVIQHGDVQRLLEDEGLGPKELEIRVRSFLARVTPVH
jgi:deoxyxylulose-5-phosphate synthase